MKNFITDKQTLNEKEREEIINFLTFYSRYDDINNLDLNKEEKIIWINYAVAYAKKFPLSLETDNYFINYHAGEFVPMLIKKKDFKFLQELVSAGVKLKRAINFTEDLYIKGGMLESRGKYFHPIVVLLMSQDVEFDESFLWNFVKDALSPEVPPEYLYYYLNTNRKYNEPSKYGSKSAFLVYLMKTKPENYLVKAKILIRYGADKTFCDEDGKCFNDYATAEELEELKKIKTRNFLKRKK